MSRNRRYHRYALTPAGAGVLSLFFPGIVIAVVARQPLLTAVCVGAGLSLVANAAAARWYVSDLIVSANGGRTSMVGGSYPVAIHLDGRRALECVVGVDGGVRPWVPAITPARGEMLVAAGTRGRVDEVTVRVQTAVPFGLVGCTARWLVPLQAPVHVGPGRIDVELPPTTALAAELDVTRGDEALGLRPYTPGDSPRDVHWPAVARTGSLVVQDRRRTTGSQDADVVVDAVEGVELDELLGRALSAVEQLMASGYQIRLTTTEAGVEPGTATTVVAPVASGHELAARLALATAGRPDRGSRNSVPQLIVDREGVRWRSRS